MHSQENTPTTSFLAPDEVNCNESPNSPGFSGTLVMTQGAPTLAQSRDMEAMVLTQHTSELPKRDAHSTPPHLPQAFGQQYLNVGTPSSQRGSAGFS
mmetsp:Transcript_28902/g.40614  ORF Transcript_28902/g.40614 Transcript_28902/m.40614 type:complete len:97 (-) Transcript_28902:635-925(-)